MVILPCGCETDFYYYTELEDRLSRTPSIKHRQAYKRFFSEKYPPTSTHCENQERILHWAEKAATAWLALPKEERRIFFDAEKEEIFEKNCTKMVDKLYERNKPSKRNKYKLPLTKTIAQCCWQLCHKSFETESALRKHLKMIHVEHDPRPYVKCEWSYCSKQMLQKDAYDHICDVHNRSCQFNRMTLPELIPLFYYKMRINDVRKGKIRKHKYTFIHCAYGNTVYIREITDPYDDAVPSVSFVPSIKKCIFHPDDDLTEGDDGKLYCNECTCPFMVSHNDDKVDKECFTETIEGAHIDLRPMRPDRRQLIYEISMYIKTLSESIPGSEGCNMIPLQIKCIKLAFAIAECFIFENREEMLAFASGIMAKMAPTFLDFDISTVPVAPKVQEKWCGMIDERLLQYELLQLVDEGKTTIYCMKLGLPEEVRANVEKLSQRMYESINMGHYERIPNYAIYAAAIWFAIQACPLALHKRRLDDILDMIDLEMDDEKSYRFVVTEWYNDFMPIAREMLPGVEFKVVPRLKMSVDEDGRITYDDLKEYLEKKDEIKAGIRKRVERICRKIPIKPVVKRLRHTYPFVERHKWTIVDFADRMTNAELAEEKLIHNFSCPAMPYATWSLLLWPRGKREKKAGHVSIFLQMASPKAPLGPNVKLSVVARYSISFLDDKNKPVRRISEEHEFVDCLTKKSKIYGRHLTAEQMKKCIRNDGSLVISCRVKVCDDKQTKPASENPVPS